MKPFYALVPALLAAACTFSSGDNLIEDGQLHLPLTYQPWEMTHYKAPDGARICALSTGYHGMTVLLRKQKDGSIKTAARGNRTMGPGVTFTVSANGQRFETSDEYFADGDAAALAGALSKGGKAYIEWSEPHLRPGASREHIDNIVTLEHFSMQLGECRKSLERHKKKS